MGFVYVQAPDTDLGWIGDTRDSRTRCSTCGPHRQAEYLKRIDGLTPEMRAWTFENTARHARNGRAFDDAKALASLPEWFFTLAGPYGTGKTRLLSCIVNAGRAASWPSVYMTTAALLDHLRSAYAPKSEIGFDALWERIVTARILAIDELDRWNPTPWAQEKFFQLIDERYRNGTDRLTVFATNSSPDDLPGYVTSRMFDRRCRVYELTGADVRRMRA